MSLTITSQALKFILLSRFATSRAQADNRIFTAPVRWLKKTSYKDSIVNGKANKADGGYSQIIEILKNRLSTDTLKPGDLKSYNGFRLFDVEQNFKIDPVKLQREMRSLQNILHPDRFVSQSADIEELANDLSALINEFYYILGHPYERGKYLLSLMSNKSREEIEESLDTLQMDPEFLAKMMEIRETIEDRANDSQVMRRLHIELEDELNEITTKLDKDFEAKDIDSILRRLGKLKFVANCHRSVSDRLGTFSNF